MSGPVHHTLPRVCHPVMLKPFGKAWSAYRMWVFDHFRQCVVPPSTVQRMNTPSGFFHIRPWDEPERYRFPWVGWIDEAARLCKVAQIPDGHGPLEFEHYVSVEVGASHWNVWVAWFEARNLPPITPEVWTKFVWMPQKHPDGFELKHHRAVPGPDEEGDHHAFG